MVNFPISLDTLTNPTSWDNLDSVWVVHTDQHSNANDAIEALEAKVWVNSSLDTNSLDYKVTALWTSKEDVANKATTMSWNITSNIIYLTAKAIYDWATGLFVPLTRNLTINWTTYDLSADRSWTISKIVPLTNTEITNTATTINANTTDIFTITALASADTIWAPTWTPVNWQKLIIRIKDNGTAQTLSWNTIFRASSDLALPTTTIINKTLYLWFIYNSTDTKWDLIALLNNF